VKSKLYIIGNGFDLHHGIDSRYSDFADYLEYADQDTFRVAEEYVVPERDLWSALEERLAEIDIDQIEDYATNYLPSYGADDWKDSGHHDYEYEIEQICDAISKDLRRHFASWVRQIEIPDERLAAVQSIDPAGLFLSFNYTDTLRSVYGVDKSHVLHIHGSAADPNSEIVLGHGWDRRPSDLRARLVDEATDVRVAGGFALIDDLLAATFKPTKDIIERNQDFFRRLGTVKEVFVLGHSLAQVDGAYFHAVLENLNPDAQWTISYYGDQLATLSAAQTLGIPSERLRLAKLADL